MTTTQTHLQACDATYASLGRPLYGEIVNALRSGNAFTINAVASKVARLAKIVGATPTMPTRLGDPPTPSSLHGQYLALKVAAACLAAAAGDAPVTVRKPYSPPAAIGPASPSVGSFAHGGRGDNFPNCAPQARLWPLGWPQYWQLGGFRY